MNRQERALLRGLALEAIQAHAEYVDLSMRAASPVLVVQAREKWWAATERFRNALTPEEVMRLLDAADKGEP